MTYHRQIFNGKLAGVNIYDLYSQLDNTLFTTEERRDLLFEILYPDSELHDFFVQFFEARFEKDIDKSHFKTVAKTTTPLSENNNVCQCIEKMGTYLINSPDQRELNKENDLLSMYKIERNKKKEISLYTLAMILKVFDEKTAMSIILDYENDRNANNYKLSKKPRIEKSDLEDEELFALRDYQNMINHCELLLQISKAKRENRIDDIPEKHKNKPELTNSEKAKLRKIMHDCRTDMIELKLAIKKPIYAKSPREDSIEADYLTFFNFTDSKHVRRIMKLNPQHLFTDLSHIIYDVEVLLSKCELTEFEKQVLKLWRIEDETEKTIAQKLDVIQPKINKTIYSISKKIISQYEAEKYDFIHLNYIKGEYKKCAKCDQIKLTVHFHKNATKSDGYESYCKKCRKELGDIKKERL